MRAALLALGTSLVATTAPAAVMTYTDAMAFEALTSARVTEDFEDTTLDTSVFASSNPNVAFGGTFVVDRNDRNALQFISGRPTRSEDQFTTFNLAGPVFAVSFDIFNFGAGEDVTFALDNTAGDSFALDGPVDGFFGFISDSAFSSFTIFDDDADTVFAMEDLTVGQLALSAIPVPASLPLLLGALGAVGYAARRSRRPA